MDNTTFCDYSESAPRSRFYSRLANVGILGKEREPGVGNLGWHGNFDTGFERYIYFVI